MRKLFMLLLSVAVLSTSATIKMNSQQANDIQKDMEQLKKADRRMQAGLQRCSKEIKASNQTNAESTKAINTQIIDLKANIDSVQNHYNQLKRDITSKQEQLSTKVMSISIRLWLCVLILLIIAAYIFFGVIGAIKKNKLMMEARILNDKETLELTIKKVEKEYREKLQQLEEQIASFKK